MHSAFIAEPSLAGDVAVFRSADLAWHVPEGRDAPERLDTGPGHLHWIRGNPHRREVIASIRTGNRTETRVLNLEDGTVRTLHDCTGSYTAIGWKSPDEIVLVREDNESSFALTCVTLSIVDGTMTPLELSHLDSLDVAPDGALYGTSAGLHPAQFRSYRGGGAGKLLAGSWSEGLERLSTHVYNAAHACVLFDRVFYLDDPDGTVNVFSLPLDAANGTPEQHTHFTGHGATTLHRGTRRLIVGSVGAAWILDPLSERSTRIQGPEEDHLQGLALPDAPSAPTSVDRATLNPESSHIAILGDGAALVASTTTHSTWHIPDNFGWIIDAAWADDDLLVILSRKRGCTLVSRLQLGSFILTQVPIAELEAIRFDHVASRGDTVVLSSAEHGVAKRNPDASITWLTRTSALKRSRPSVSTDGAYAIWDEQSGGRGRVIRVADLFQHRVETIAASAANCYAPAFGSHGRLWFIMAKVSPWSGAAAPLSSTGTLHHVRLAAVLAGEKSDAVTTVARRLPPAEALLLSDGVWIHHNGALQRVTPEASRPDWRGRFVGDAGTLALVDDTAASAGSRLQWGADANQMTVPAFSAHAPEAVVEELLDLISTRTNTRRQADDDGYLCRHLRDLVGRVKSDHDLTDVLQIALREVGQSHAAISHSTQKKTTFPPAQPDFPSIVRSAREITRDALGDKACYLPLSDVSTTGTAAVERLCAEWTGHLPLVVDLRFNQGGEFADYIAALLGNLLHRKATAINSDDDDVTLLSGPPYLNILLNEHTGSGGEHLAAVLSQYEAVITLGRRTAGAGTGYRRTWSLGAGRRVVLPQYRLGGGPTRDKIENFGVEPEVKASLDVTNGANFDDGLLSILPRPPRNGPQSARQRRFP